jgi:hypothetical protein
MTIKQRILNKFLSLIFSVVKPNTPYGVVDFLSILVTAGLTNDFVNNTSMKIKPGPNGQSLFNRLVGCTQEKVEDAFNCIMEKLLKRIRGSLRNRRVVLAFDTTLESFYGKITNNWFWIHDYNPVRGCTGSFQFITVSIVVGEKKFILGALPVPRVWNKADFVEKLIHQVRKYVKIECCLFDRGFTGYELVERLKILKVGYMIFWIKKQRNDAWATKELKTMKPRELKEHIRTSYYDKNKTRHWVKTRFILIKQYTYTGDIQPYDWVFATNLKLKSQMWYIRRYKTRWGIETSYRVTGEIRIKTTTLDETNRYFLFVFTCLMYNLWKFANLLLKTKVTFATFIWIFFDLVKEKLNKIKEPPPHIKQTRLFIQTHLL